MEARRGLWLFCMLWSWLGVLEAEESQCPPALDFEVRTLAETERVNLCQSYLGKEVLPVNTASRCAFTPQYAGLEAIYRRYGDRGLVVLGFPSNDSSFVGPESRELLDAIELLL